MQICCLSSAHFHIILNLCSLSYKLFAGQKFYYNSQTNVSQWERPSTPQQVAIPHHDRAVANNATNVTWVGQASTFQRCLECGGWGVGLVQSWGYCKHCTRYVVIAYISPFDILCLFVSSLFLYNATAYRHFCSSKIPTELELLVQLLGFLVFVPYLLVNVLQCPYVQSYIYYMQLN